MRALIIIVVITTLYLAWARWMESRTDYCTDYWLTWPVRAINALLYNFYRREVVEEVIDKFEELYNNPDAYASTADLPLKTAAYRFRPCDEHGGVIDETR